MLWTDTFLIAEKLADNHADIDPLSINFVTLRTLITQLKEFNDDPQRCNEKILEAIQLEWLNEIN